MRRAKLLRAATLAVLLGMIPSVSAQAQEGRTKMGFNLGPTRVGAGSFDRGAAQLNLRIGIERSRMLESEFALYGAEADESPLPGVTRRVDYIVLAANVVLNFHPRPAVSPYLLVGLGIGVLEFEAVGLSTSDMAWAIQGAGGCRWDLGKTRRSGIRLEASVGSLQRATWSADEREGGNVRTLGLSLGYVYVVRGHAPVP